MLRRLLRGCLRSPGSLSAVGSTDIGSVAPCLGVIREAFGIPLQIQGYKTDPNAEPEERQLGNERVRRIADEIVSLNLLEIADLTEILQQRLRTPMMGMPMGMPAGYGAPYPPQPPGGAPPPAEEAPKVVEKTEFAVKLESFDAASKIKVIKEVREATKLALKEAKELVEKSPVVVKEGLSKEEAENLQKKIEAAGGKALLE
eukprot:jgi/Botrbrau1/12281/Bobra.0323s0021.1